jgi:hypothetical protein
VLRFVVAALLDPALTKNKTYGVQAESLSFNDAVAIVEKLQGKKVKVTYRPVPEVQSRVGACLAHNDFMGAFEDMLALSIATHAAQMKEDWSHKFPSVTKCVTLEEYLKSELSKA